MQSLDGMLIGWRVENNSNEGWIGRKAYTADPRRARMRAFRFDIQLAPARKQCSRQSHSQHRPAARLLLTGRCSQQLRCCGEGRRPRRPPASGARAPPAARRERHRDGTWRRPRRAGPRPRRNARERCRRWPRGAARAAAATTTLNWRRRCVPKTAAGGAGRIPARGRFLTGPLFEQIKPARLYQLFTRQPDSNPI